jgi:hypothetical protein
VASDLFTFYAGAVRYRSTLRRMTGTHCIRSADQPGKPGCGFAWDHVKGIGLTDVGVNEFICLCSFRSVARAIDSDMGPLAGPFLHVAVGVSGHRKLDTLNRVFSFAIASASSLRSADGLS